MPLKKDELRLLKQFACLPPEFQSYEILEDLTGMQYNPDDSNFPEILETLLDKGWLLQNRETDRYKMHRIIGDVIRKQDPLTLPDVKQLIEIIIEKLRIDQTRDNPVEKFPWIPYGHALLAVFPSSDDTAIATLQNNLAVVLEDLGDYKDALGLSEKSA